MNQPLIQTVELKKYYKVKAGELHAVDDVNLSIQESQTLGVVGESGCGKTTLGRTILRLVPATSGQILFRGENILEYSGKQMHEMRRNMQIIFQDPYSSINPRMTVYNIIAEPIRSSGTRLEKQNMDKRVRKLMDTVGLASRLIKAYPHELDGGRRQRIGVARALALNPKFIVCDEPVSSLDVSIQAQILNLLMDLQDEYGLTYMFITHDLSVVKHISDNIAVMYLGECVEHGPKDQIFANQLHPYSQALLSAIPVPSLAARSRKPYLIKGEVSSPINPKPGCRFAPRCPHVKPICTQGELELKEVTPNHFVRCTLYGSEKP